MLLQTLSKLALLAAFLLCSGCARPLGSAVGSGVALGLSIPQGEEVTSPRSDIPLSASSSFEGAGDANEMNEAEREIARKDPQGNYLLDAVRVEAKFRNVAERCGVIELGFNICVPAEFLDRRWQLRLDPVLHYLGRDETLESLYITGQEYRNRQIKGYNSYQAYLSSILADSSLALRYRHLLEVYIQRYDWSQTAYEHYVRKIRMWNNRRRRRNIPQAYSRYVKNPYPPGGVRLDSVVRSAAGENLVYHYSQQITSFNQIKKIELTMQGSIWNYEKNHYELPSADTVTFYVSSLSSLANLQVKYVDSIVYRRDRAIYDAKLMFAASSAELDMKSEANSVEAERISWRIRDILDEGKFSIDSISIKSFCSPEGPLNLNRALGQRRAESVKRYLDTSFKSIARGVRGLSWNLITNEMMADEIHIPDINCEYGQEDWEGLLELLEKENGNLCALGRELSVESNPERRKISLRSSPSYKYIASHLLPQLRRVRIEFVLSRLDMVKDTIHTSVVDRYYMSGVEALCERDYKRAMSVLRPYSDINSALAALSLNYNATAREILVNLASSAKRNYLLAIALSRIGKVEEAASFLKRSIEQEGHMRFRANLDPEARALLAYIGD